jgi:hypothetical protein
MGLMMGTEILQMLADKKISKTQLVSMMEANFGLLPKLVEGTSSSKATVRYGCGNTLVALSEKHPEKLYPYFDAFVKMLDSQYRILTWTAMAIIANLTAVDKDGKFDKIFDKYYSYLGNEYMVTVANVVGNSAKIAEAKPYLTQKIINELLKVQDIEITPHLTEECKLVIAEKAIQTFNALHKNADDKRQLLVFVRAYINSTRTSLRNEAQNFVKKYQ